MQDLSSAVYIISTLLYDLNERLKKAVDEEYKSRKKREQ